MGFELQEQKSDGTYQTVASTDSSSYYKSDTFGTEYVGNNSPASPSLSDQLASGPLGALFNSKYRYDRLQYPADLGSAGKNHMIIFDVYNAHSTTIDEVNTWVTKTASAVAESFKGASVQGAVDGITNAANAAVELANSKNAMGTIGDKISSTMVAANQTVSSFLETKKDFVKSVYLYMPDTLDFSYSANWERTSLAEAAASAPIVGGLASKVTQILDNKAAQLALNKLGYAFNPQAQMLFEGIDFREFSMSFVFTPRSIQEAELVKEIIKTFRMYAAPTVVSEAAGFFFKPPGIFGIRFESNGRPNNNINQITDSVLQSVEVNYAPNGWSAHKDGKPVQTTMTLNFKEIILVDRTKISQGY